MEPYQQRVIDERTELAERLGRLRAYLGKTQNVERLLSIQHDVMTAYLTILDARIAAW